MADEILASALLPGRPFDAHKGTFGTALVAAGSLNYTGAPDAGGQGRLPYRRGTGHAGNPGTAAHGAGGSLPEATWCAFFRTRWAHLGSAPECDRKNLERLPQRCFSDPASGWKTPPATSLQNLLTGNAAVKSSRHGRIGFVKAEAKKADRKLQAASFRR